MIGLERIVPILVFASWGLTLAVPGCERHPPTPEEYRAALEKMREKPIHFYGRVVYEDGIPAAGAVVELKIDSVEPVQTQLRANGFGDFVYHGSGSFLRVESVRGQGQWLYEADPMKTSKIVPQNIGYYYDDQVGYLYVPDEDSPAVFVLVRPGHDNVSVWPSRGGQECFPSGECVKNEPRIPREPSVSLKQDVAWPRD